MSNRKHRFSLSVLKRNLYGGNRQAKYYVINTGKGDGNRGRVCNMEELKHAVEYHNTRTRDFSTIDLVYYLTVSWGHANIISCEHIGNFESIPDIIEIIEVLQL